MMEEKNIKTVSWIKLLLRTLTWEKITIFWILGMVSYFIIFITINPPPPPDFEFFKLIVKLVEETIGWVAVPLIGGNAIGTAGQKILNSLKRDDIKK